MKSSWISTKVKLPRKNREVLAYVVRSSGSKSFDITWYEGNDEWAMGSMTDYRVTHWQPLVKP